MNSVFDKDIMFLSTGYRVCLKIDMFFKQVEIIAIAAGLNFLSYFGYSS